MRTLNGDNSQFSQKAQIVRPLYAINTIKNFAPEENLRYVIYYIIVH